MITKPDQRTSVFIILFSLLCAGVSSAQVPKFFGTVWKRWSSVNDAPDNLLTYFDQVTPENAGKWGARNWDYLDAMYAYAETNNFLTKQHTFVWGQQQPDNITSKDQVENWMKEYMKRYGDKVDMIDVVNEPLHAKPYYKDAIGGDGETGWDWVLWSFETARTYAPNAKLILNDYNIVKSRSETNKYLNLITILMEGGNLDGIGLQAHFLESTSGEVIKGNLDLLAETGLPLYISEFELHIASDADHSKKMQEIFPVFWEHPAVAGVTVWGHEQGKMWRENGYLIKSDGSERAAMTWLKKYLEENPLTYKPVSIKAFPFTGNDHKTDNRFIRIFTDVNAYDLDPNKNIRIYNIDGRLRIKITGKKFHSRSLSISPSILMAK